MLLQRIMEFSLFCLQYFKLFIIKAHPVLISSVFIFLIRLLDPSISFEDPSSLQTTRSHLPQSIKVFINNTNLMQFYLLDPGTSPQKFSLSSIGCINCSEPATVYCELHLNAVCASHAKELHTHLNCSFI